MKEIIFLIEEALEGGFTARALGFSIFTDAETMDELKANIREAICCYFDEKGDFPKVIRLHFVKDEIMAI
ncbi:MAG TPA: 2-oxoisovalerate dehydrogenase [Firmicutes bacterium]|nr:2-oxoisovalerate dehydrogenase [Bacillota bacterium]